MVFRGFLFLSEELTVVWSFDRLSIFFNISLRKCLLWLTHNCYQDQQQVHDLFCQAASSDLHGRCYICSHRGGGLKLRRGISRSPRSLPLPQRLGALGRRQELINDNAVSTEGEEAAHERERCAAAAFLCWSWCEILQSLTRLFWS